MLWFRVRRRPVAIIAVLAMTAMASIQSVCVWFAGDAAIAPVSTASVPLAPCCGPQGCTYARGDQPTRCSTALPSSLARLSVAAFFLNIGILSIAKTPPILRARLPGYPPILAFYRLRI